MKKILYFLFTILLSLMTYKCNERQDDNTDKSSLGNNERISLNIGNQKKELIFTFKSIANPNIKRSWKNAKMKLNLKIGSIDDETFLFPGKIKIDQKNNIYVLDFMDYSVKKFDSSGNFIQKFGKKGRGPGELTTPFDFDVFNDGKVILLGLNDNKFILFEKKEIKDIKCTLTPNRICFINSNEALTFQLLDPVNQSPFQKFNLNNEEISEYQNIISKESFGGKDFGVLPFLVGDIHQYNSSKSLYISSIYGYVVVFNDEGKIEKTFKLIDKVVGSEQKRKQIFNENNEVSMISFPKLNEYLFISSNVYGDYLYILPNPVQRDTNKYIIDVYSISKGDYQFSVLLPESENILATFMTNNKIYIAKENTEVLVYDYSIEN